MKVVVFIFIYIFLYFLRGTFVYINDHRRFEFGAELQDAIPRAEMKPPRPLTLDGQEAVAVSVVGPSIAVIAVAVVRLGHWATSLVLT